ncbi:MAG: putative sulfate exporter family transporter [Deltaproteobacteria bacterium]|nr:putative sulfate exporter family transporter [Deltaproteobacteria bacterium]
MKNQTVIKIIFIVAFLATALPFFTSAYALILGTGLSLLLGNPLPKLTAESSKQLLKLSVIGLGFGVNFLQVIQTGKSSIGITFISIFLTIIIGTYLGKLFKVAKNTSSLIAFGTAICGGSAIAAMAPVIQADDNETAVSLATVFTLNAVALLIFPTIGHLLGLTQHQFGLFAALAIHDTSSVVGAAATFGATALAIGTTVKLTRALWIAPISLIAGFRSGNTKKTSFPLFILGIIAAAILNTYLTQFNSIWHVFSTSSKQLLVMTLFLIGTGLTKQVLAEVGIKPMLMGVILWIIVSISTLTAITTGILH